MRCLAITLILLAAATAWPAETKPRPATAAEVALLKEATKNTDQDVDHWAYTETTTVKVSKGRQRLPTIVRFDPSKPYAEQYTILSKDGKPPSERDLKKYREKGEKRGESRARAFARAEGQKTKPTVEEDRTDADFERLLVVEDTAERITFEVPLKTNRRDMPVEKLQALVVVGKQKRQVEKAVMRIKKAFRMKLVAKFNAGEASVVFTVVDPAYPPLMTTMTGNFGLSFLFIPLDADAISTRTEWQRVKAFDERFSVKMAPLQMLGF